MLCFCINSIFASLRIACIYASTFHSINNPCSAVIGLSLPWQMLYIKSALNLDIIVVKPEDNPDVLFVQHVNHIRESYFADILRSSKALRIFHTSENTDHYSFSNDELDLSFGLRCVPGSAIECVRFPYWFNYAVSWKDCKLKEINNITYEEWRKRPIFTSLVSSHGNYPREELFETLSQIDFVAAPGKFMHNVPSLGPSSQAKMEFLKKSRFNLCPENNPGIGYVTEKIVQAFMAGCIPIYWNGAASPVEPEVFNQQRIINLVKLKQNFTLLSQSVSEMNSNEKVAREYFDTPILSSTAQAYVSNVCQGMIDAFEKGLSERNLYHRLEESKSQNKNTYSITITISMCIFIGFYIVYKRHKPSKVIKP